AVTGGEQLTLAAAVAASLAGPAADLAANLNIQVHGGIGFTWEHDAHLYLRRATVLQGLLDPDAAAAEALRHEIRTFAESVKDLDREAQKARLIETGYVMPHWPKPWGREAGAV